MPTAALDSSANGARPPTVPWSSFGPILAIHFLGTLGFSLAIPFLVFIVADLGGASWTYGLVGATYSAFQLFGAPLLGRWSDRTGRRPVLVASQIGTFAAWLLFFVALSLPVVGMTDLAGATLTLPLLLVFAARALDGATGGNISVANAYVADLTQEHPEARQIAFWPHGNGGEPRFCHWASCCRHSRWNGFGSATADHHCGRLCWCDHDRNPATAEGAPRALPQGSTRARQCCRGSAPASEAVPQNAQQAGASRGHNSRSRGTHSNRNLCPFPRFQFVLRRLSGSRDSCVRMDSWTAWHLLCGTRRHDGHRPGAAAHVRIQTP